MTANQPTRSTAKIIKQITSSNYNLGLKFDEADEGYCNFQDPCLVADN